MQFNFRGAVLGTILVIVGNQASGAVSNFNTNKEGWDSVGFGISSYYPDFTNAPVVGTGVTFVPSSGNPGGYISKQDPDGNWQYFSAPSAFLGNQISTIGGLLTFDLIRLDGFSTQTLNPQGPLVAITNGSLVLVYASTAIVPTTAGWSSYAVPFTIGPSWRLADPNGAAATQTQFNSVLSGLTGLYLLGDFTNGSGDIMDTNGDSYGLDNVNFAVVSEPSSIALALFGLAVLAGLGRARFPHNFSAHRRVG